MVLAAPGLLALVAVVLAFLFHRPIPPAKGTAGTNGGGSGAGYYHVLGFDSRTNARREMTLHADSAAGARGRAEMEDIVVTEVTPVGSGDELP